MKRHIWLFLVGGLMVVLAWHVYASYSLVDGFQGFLWRTLTGEDTLFARGYTDHGFMDITNGMSRGEVYRHIGSPLNVWTNQDSTIGERWSKSPSDGNFRCRVVFFTGSVVSGKHSEFYQD